MKAAAKRALTTGAGAVVIALAIGITSWVGLRGMSKSTLRARLPPSASEVNEAYVGEDYYFQARLDPGPCQAYLKALATDTRMRWHPPGEPLAPEPQWRSADSPAWWLAAGESGASDNIYQAPSGKAQRLAKCEGGHVFYRYYTP